MTTPDATDDDDVATDDPPQVDFLTGTHLSHHSSHLARGGPDTPLADLLPPSVLDHIAAALVGLQNGTRPTIYVERHARHAIRLTARTLLSLLALLFVARFIALPPPVGSVAGAATVAVAFGALRFVVALVMPLFVVDLYRRHLDRSLPHAILSLHALSGCGVDLTTAINEVAALETAGAVAGEFAQIRDDVAWFGGDLVSALERRRDETPSDQFAVFLDELLTVVQTGGDVPSFLAEAVDEHFQSAAERQERLAQATATYAEGYVTLVFAAPIFLLVVLVVIGLVEPAARRFAALLVYGGIPVLLLGFAVLFRLRAPPLATTDIRNPIAPRPGPPEPPADKSSLAERHVQERSRRHFQRAFTETRSYVTESPLRALIPGVLVAMGVLLVLFAVIEPTRPFTASIQIAAYVAVPLLVAIVPFAIIHEVQRRRMNRVRERVPAALEVLADGINNGVPITAVFGLAARRTTGRLAAALRQIDRDIAWHAPVPDAIVRIRHRIQDEATIQAVELVGNALEATHDVGDVVHTVARYVQDRNELLAERRTQTFPYVAVVAIGVLVFLGIVALFDVFFLEPVAAIEPRDAASISTGTTDSPTQAAAFPQPSSVDVQAYRRLLYHASVIQALGNGLVLGLVVDDRLATGAKYVVGFLAATILTLVGIGLIH